MKTDKSKQEFHLIDVEDSKNVFFISTTNKAFLNRLGINFNVTSPINENGYASVEFSLGESSINIDVINNDLNPVISELKKSIKNYDNEEAEPSFFGGDDLLDILLKEKSIDELKIICDNVTNFLKFSEIAEIKIGFPLMRKKQGDQREIDYDFVSLQGFFNEDNTYDGSYINKVKLSEKLNSEQHQKFAVKKGDILIRIRNPIKAVYVDKKYKNLFLSDLVVCVRNYKDYDANFLVSYFNAYADQEFNNSKQINLNNIASIKIPNFKQNKQKEVSNFISNIDNRNRELREQIQKNNELKKTTLQGLIDEWRQKFD